MRVTGIVLLLLFAAAATAAPRTKENEWMSAERAVRSETLEHEVQAALEAALDKQQNDDQKLAFVKDGDQIQEEVMPQDDDYVVPSYSPVGSENEFGSPATDKLTPSLILDIEKHLQAEMGQMEGQLSLLHKLVSSIFGPQVTLNPKEDFDPNVVVVNVPQQQGGIGDQNPFTLGLDPLFNDNPDNNDGNVDDGNDDDEAWDPWVQDSLKFPSLSDVFGLPDSQDDAFGFSNFGDISHIGFSENETDFGFSNFFENLPDEWSNLPSNYSNSTHKIQHVNGSIIAVDETINKQSGDGFNFFSDEKVINVHPEGGETHKDFDKVTEEEIEEETEEETEGTEEDNEEHVNGDESVEDNEIVVQNEKELEGENEDVPLVENEIENEFSEFPGFKTEGENDIEDEETLIPNWRNWRSQQVEEFPLGGTLDEGLSINHEPLILPSDQLLLPDDSVFGRKYENEDHDHDLVDVVSDQIAMPEKSAYYDIRNLKHDNKNSVHNYESTYRDLSDDTRVNRVSSNKSGMRMIDPNAEIFDYKRVLEELKPIQ